MFLGLVRVLSGAQELGQVPLWAETLAQAPAQVHSREQALARALAQALAQVHVWEARLVHALVLVQAWVRLWERELVPVAGWLWAQGLALAPAQGLV